MTVKEAHDDFCFAKDWERAARIKRDAFRKQGQTTGEWLAAELAEVEFSHAVEHLAKAAERLAEVCLRAMTEVLNERERLDFQTHATYAKARELRPLFLAIEGLKAS